MRAFIMADRKTERVKEQIKYETERWRFLCLLTIAIGGGSLSLLLGDPTPLRLGLAIIGLLATVLLTLVVWRQDRRIMTLIDQIPTEDL
jgi:hypothetical protein